MTAHHHHWPKALRLLPLLLLLLITAHPAHAQFSGITVDLSMVDGIELNADNAFNYRINNQKGKTVQAEITGHLQYRRSAMMFTYKYTTSLQPGITTISRTTIPAPAWTFSDNALKELFFNYGKLPQGTYEYCVSVALKNTGETLPAGDPDACVYQTVNDIFLINLVDPENDAKIYDYNPMLSWVVNYPFASELTYRIRVAEQKQGQNPQNAITRNNPMYQDNHVMATGTVYPVTARPLVKFQPYVWTVDAYYKGILLGGSEVWKFTIIEDSELKALPHESFFVDIRNERSQTIYNAVGVIKIKYVLDEKNEETLSLTLRSDKGKVIKIKDKELKAVLGDNRLEIDLKDQLKHMNKYELEIVNSKGETFKLPIRYINPELIK
jgi:hypothetical protein